MQEKKSVLKFASTKVLNSKMTFPLNRQPLPEQHERNERAV